MRDFHKFSGLSRRQHSQCVSMLCEHIHFLRAEFIYGDITSSDECSWWNDTDRGISISDVFRDKWFSWPRTIDFWFFGDNRQKTTPKTSAGSSLRVYFWRFFSSEMIFFFPEMISCIFLKIINWWKNHVFSKYAPDWIILIKVIRYLKLTLYNLIDCRERISLAFAFFVFFFVSFFIQFEESNHDAISTDCVKCWKTSFRTEQLSFLLLQHLLCARFCSLTFQFGDVSDVTSI